VELVEKVRAPLSAFLKPGAPTPEEQALARDLQSRVRRHLLRLSDREREVICLRYGIGTDHEHTLEEIGRRYSVSRERIRQVEAAAMKKLRRAKVMGADPERQHNRRSA
jgi:RNA polymerase sigma factor (sigma-70 family)